MSQKITVLKIFLSSPSDLQEERALFDSIVNEVNLLLSKSHFVRLELMKWEKDSISDMGEGGQDVINRQLKDYDIFIGIMGKRFGSPTKNCDSGTEEEFNIAYKKYIENPKNIKIMFYFNDSPISPSEIDIEQLKKVNDFKSLLEEKGLYRSYKDITQFTGLMRIHLNSVAVDWGKTWGDFNEGVIHDTLQVEKESQIINLNNFDSEEEDFGLIEYIEMGELSFGETNESLDSMSNAVKDFGAKLVNRTQEINQLNENQKKNPAIVKLILNRAAQNMEDFNEELKFQIEKYSDGFNKGMDAYIKSLNFYKNDKESDVINKSRGALNDMKTQIKFAVDAIDSFTKQLSLFPKFTQKMNKANISLVQTLELVLSEYSKSIYTIEELVKEL